MSLEAQIERLNVNLEKLLAAGGIAAAPAAGAEKQKGGKAAASAAAVAAATQKQTPEQIAAAAQAPVEREVTKEDIQKCGEDLSQLAEKNRAKAVALLGEFGVAKMTALPTAKIPEFHNKVKAALADGGAPSLI